jgi:hypothetical protein
VPSFKNQNDLFIKQFICLRPHDRNGGWDGTKEKTSSPLVVVDQLDYRMQRFLLLLVVSPCQSDYIR